MPVPRTAQVNNDLVRTRRLKRELLKSISSAGCTSLPSQPLVKRFFNLDHLTLTMTSNRDADSLQACQQLRSLKLDVPQIVTHAASASVWELRALTHLHIIYSPSIIHLDLQPIAQLKKLLTFKLYLRSPARLLPPQIEAICACTRLESLELRGSEGAMDVSRNNLGELPVKLTSLVLDFGYVLQVHLRHISRLTQLHQLRVRARCDCYVQLHGTFLTAITHITTLSKLAVSGKGPWVYRLGLLSEITRLTSLTLGGSEVTLAEAASIARLSRLEALTLPCYISAPSLTTQVEEYNWATLSPITRLSRLTRLTIGEIYSPLSREGFDDKSFQFAQRMPQLKHVKIQAPQDIGAVCLRGFAHNLAGLVSLDISNWSSHKHGVQDGGVNELMALHGLTSLNVASGGWVTNATLAAVGNMRHLQDLDLSDVGRDKYEISETSLRYLTDLAHLTRLKMDWNQWLGDQGLTMVCHCSNLQYLDVSECRRITRDGLLVVSSRLRLRRLIVRQLLIAAGMLELQPGDDDWLSGPGGACLVTS